MPDISSPELVIDPPPGFRLVSRLIKLYLLGDDTSNGSHSTDTAKFFCRWSRSAPASIATRALFFCIFTLIRFRSLFRVSFIHAYLR